MRQIRPWYCGPASLRIVQREIGHPLFSQHEWARLASTTRGGTGPAGMKRGLELLGVTPRVVRARRAPFKLAVVYDAARDHWLVARVFGRWVIVMDPANGAATPGGWSIFQRQFLSSATRSYALVIS